MNKLFTLAALLLMLFNSYAQEITFEKILPPSESKNISFMGLTVGTPAAADIDNDGDLDIIIVGANDNGHYTTVLYKNDGSGNFVIENDTPFDGARSGCVAFADVDNDNDMDVIIAGQRADYYQYTNLYLNDGYGDFSLVENTPFEAATYGAINFADVDADNDLDVLLTGDDLAKLYINDGFGNYTESIENLFLPAKYGGADIADVDGDLDLDIIITGDDDEYIARTTLYLNNGQGVFTEDVDATSIFEQVFFSSVCFGDADNDSDNDIILCGTNNSNQKVTRLYINDGIGNFSLDNTSNFDNVSSSCVFFADLDNDNDNDVYITGIKNSSDIRYSEIYENNGGVFTKVNADPLELKTEGKAISVDIDGDNDLDIIATGGGNLYSRTRYFSQLRTTIVYTNEGNMKFRRVLNSSIDNFSKCDFDYADIDSDSDLDIVIAGESYNGIVTKVFKNDGAGNYIESANIDMNGHDFNGSVNLADIDGDNDADLLITGVNSSLDKDYTSVLYTNNGSGEFQMVNSSPFVNVNYGTSTFFDVDNDDDLDLLITGEAETEASVARLYKNDGTGVFTEVLDTPIEGVRNGTVAYADIDGDNDLDLVVAGSSCTKRSESSMSCTSKINLYTNDGSGNFTMVTSHNLPVISYGAIQFGDVDNDGDPDLLITGEGTQYRRYAKIYKNNGAGIFIEDTSIPLTGVNDCSVSFGNVNNDGFIDILINGETIEYREITTLYQNDGNGSFSEVETVIMDGSSNGCVAFLDVDNDGDDDVLTSGSGFTALYRNVTDGDFEEKPDFEPLEPYVDVKVSPGMIWTDDEFCYSYNALEVITTLNEDASVVDSANINIHSNVAPNEIIASQKVYFSQRDGVIFTTIGNRERALRRGSFIANFDMESFSQNNLYVEVLFYGYEGQVIGDGFTPVSDYYFDPIVWNDPIASSISPGESLQNSILTEGAASVCGQFVFENPEVIPPAGTYNAQVQFIPTQTSIYYTIELTVPVEVSVSTTIDAKNDQSKCIVTFNSLSNAIAVDMGDDNILDIAIYNIDGTLLDQFKGNGSSVQKIDKRFSYSGICVVKVSGNNNVIKRKVFIP